MADIEISAGLEAETATAAAASRPEDGDEVQPTDQVQSRAPFGSVSTENNWEKHKDTIQKLYLEESKPLRVVMEIMSRDHDFSASSMMYKKKFGQWKFKTNRKGWDKRSASASSNTANIQSRLSKGQQVPGSVELPASLKLQVAALHRTCNVLTERLRPLTLSEPVPISMPRCFTDFHQYIFSGSELALTGKPSTVGAIFSKAFAQVEPMLRSGYCFDFIYFQVAMVGSKYYGRSEIMDMVLDQTNKMATKIYGRNHATALWTRCVLDLPPASRGDAIEWFAKAGISTSASVLTKARDYALNVRVRGMMIQLYNNPDITRLTKEWDKVIQEVQDDEALYMEAMYFYGHAMREVGQNRKAADLSKDYCDLLRRTTKEDGLSPKTLWYLLSFNSTYSQALAKLGEDEEAEEAFKLNIMKTKELVGEDHPSAFAAKGNYAVFLKSRNRPPEEVEKASEEFEKDLKDDVLKSDS